MRRTKTNYELGSSQVATPSSVVSLYWQLVRERRPKLPRVIDFGAGDGRFSRGGYYDRYVGVEIDRAVARHAHLPRNGQMRIGCAFTQTDTGFDACIGNPPYVRHHDIESPWKQKTLASLSNALNARMDGHANLFLYFIALGLIKTNAKGLVALLVPFEWVSRPSAKALRLVMAREKWNVSVYRFEQPIFDDVLTTASISIIDKADRGGQWSYFDISQDFKIRPRAGINGNGRSVIAHARRGTIYARRGMSPGSQKIFTLTEGERIHHGLRLTEVRPCVTSLRSLSSSVRNLDQNTFQRNFVQAGRRCWLIKSSERMKNKRLQRYLDAIPSSERDTYTCLHQDPWYNYEEVEPPQLLLHSAFTGHAPAVLTNTIQAINVGSVYGIYTPPTASMQRLQTYLLSCDIVAHIVPHAKTLRKIEVGQLNALLEDWWHVNATR